MAESAETTEPKPFGGVLERLRHAAGLPQEALAERAGLSVRALSELERNRTRTPRLESVTLLADAVMLEPRQRAPLLATASLTSRTSEMPVPGSERRRGRRLLRSAAS